MDFSDKDTKETPYAECVKYDSSDLGDVKDQATSSKDTTITPLNRMWSSVKNSVINTLHSSPSDLDQPHKEQEDGLLTLIRMRTGYEESERETIARFGTKKVLSRGNCTYVRSLGPSTIGLPQSVISLFNKPPQTSNQLGTELPEDVLSPLFELHHFQHGSIPQSNWSDLEGSVKPNEYIRAEYQKDLELLSVDHNTLWPGGYDTAVRPLVKGDIDAISKALSKSFSDFGENEITSFDTRVCTPDVVQDLNDWGKALEALVVVTV
ncbi:hypothetical protein TREMEDRAFT_58639 [Tremella mesenterica DSM 1558]|uniref:uncharacterized protein n=1 Tax=Tremella mesenterica (strain ATCC 24925 / CBS 8224 / DSM 1558 / NBRC 9311 / NRRL Y-6157 / RJB 2259-6 / UBC 559-6) TaxID=578456 RepID=UPI0003F4939A|nr:uncharacterized protein TREMEDRAFT_58639 [Tremella mesenterica DSM 1558]EIW72470.1 hypothetical protein TREMEDRAFT_58639 [Tremella mesenterica DSM 1558]